MAMRKGLPRAQAAAAVPPPPGLEDLMTPAKVVIGAGAPPRAPSPHKVEVPFQHEGVTHPRYAPRNGFTGEWLNAVLATAPYLDAQGLQHAIGILDCAITNVHQAKMWEDFIAGHAGADANTRLAAAGHFRAQVCTQQMALLQQLHNMRTNAAVAAGGLGAGGWTTPAGFGPAVDEQPRNADAAAAATELVLGALAGAPQPQARPLQARGPAVTGAAFPREEELAGAVTAARLYEPATMAAAHEVQTFGKERQHRPPSRQVQTLSTSLQMLSKEDPNCLFIVRRINKLGFKASRKLKQHFSAYGTVVRVLVAHSTVRQHGDMPCHARRRPSSLGFVHMASPDAVLKILAMGDEQEVDGSPVRVQRFERQRGEENPDEDEADGLPEEFDDACWLRQQTASSMASTRTASTQNSQGSEDSSLDQE